MRDSGREPPERGIISRARDRQVFLLLKSANRRLRLGPEQAIHRPWRDAFANKAQLGFKHTLRKPAQQIRDGNCAAISLRIEIAASSRLERYLRLGFLFLGLLLGFLLLRVCATPCQKACGQGDCN